MILMVEIVLTDQRIIYKTGILGVDVFELQLGKVESARIVQSLWQRMINAGTLIVTTATSIEGGAGPG